MSNIKPNVTLRNWDDFLKAQISIEEKLEAVKKSNLLFSSPEAKRNLVWCEVVPQEFAQDALNFYRQKKSMKQVSLSIATATSIREDLKKTYVGTLISLKSNQKFSQAAAILSIFALKRPDIGYHYGMNFIVAIMLHVFGGEGDAFVMFCHLIENVYPENFFTGIERKLSLHTELRIFAMMAERLRPNLANTLVAVFRPKNDTNTKRDMTPFYETMKRIAETLFLTLFSTILLPQNLLRVWDVVFLYGFEAAHKVALTLLSKDERFFKNKVKAEVKNIGLGNSIDVLLAGGNNARAKLFLKIEKVPIEKLIKKALTKAKYKSLKYEDFIGSAERLERDYMTRINRLRQTRAVLLKDNLLNNIDDTRFLFDTLRRFDHQGIISRQIFMQTVTKEFNWSKATALNVFTTFDQKGNESLDIREVLSGICILFNGPLDERLELLFKVFDINDSSYIEPDEAIDIISVLETSLDVRSNFFKVQSGELFERMDRNQDSKVTQDEFVKCLKEDPACKLIMDFLQGLESEEGTAMNLDYINFAEQGSFIDIHSPLRRSISTTPVSDLSEPSEIDEMVHKIDMLSSSMATGNINRALSVDNYMEVRPVMVDSLARNHHQILEVSHETEHDHPLGETPIAKLDVEENEQHGVEITTETVNGNIVLKLKIGDLLGLDDDPEELTSMKGSISDYGNLGDYIDMESSPVLIDNYYQDDRMYDLRATTPTEIRAIFDDEKVNVDGITYEDPAFVQVEQYFSRQSSRIEPNSGQIHQKKRLSLSRRSSGKSSLDSDSVHSERHSHIGRSNDGKKNQGQIHDESSQDFRKEDEALEKHLNKLRSMQVNQMPEDETEIDLASRVEISSSENSGGSNRICSRMCAKGGCVIF